MNYGVADISFSTITGNTANLLLGNTQEETFGGGIVHYGHTSVDEGVSVLSMGSTILAGNMDNRNRFSPDFSPDCFSKIPYRFTSHRNNLLGILNANCDFRDTTWGDTRFDHVGAADSTTNNPLDPVLDPLGPNGGQTHTHALGTSSPAIDKAKLVTSATFFDCPSKDQRGMARPVDANSDGTAECDIGAVER
jgi:hypothetical protein